MTHQDTEPLPHPEFLTEFPYNLILRRFAPVDIRATQPQLDAFRRFASLGDPPADAVVTAMREMPHGRGRQLVERVLMDGTDALDGAPEPFQTFFTQVFEVPFWLDERQLELGARAIRRSGVLGLIALRGLALMGGYLAGRPDKTLVATGSLVSDQTPRRLLETSRWWVQLTEPGALRPAGAGFTSSVRVRLIHAQVRAAMRERPDWDYAAWDHPVNQVQLAGTLVQFSLAFLIGTRMHGLRYTERERQAVVHLWRYVGYLMGVHPDLLPATEADTWRLFWLEAATEFQPDDDSRRLAQALIDGAGPATGGPVGRLVGWAAKGYLESYTRLVLGRRNADFLGVPDSKPFQAAVLANASLIGMAELVRPLVPGASTLSEWVGARSRRRLLDQAAGEPK
jgi:mpaB/rubber oxygenase-like protein